jgi:Tfp pilus assembly protein PilF
MSLIHAHLRQQLVWPNVLDFLQILFGTCAIGATVSTVGPEESAKPAASSAAPIAGNSLRLPVLLALSLALGALLLYLPALNNGFVNYDDPDYVTANAHVLQGVTAENIRWAFGTDNPAANWHPLTWISHMLDVQLFGLQPRGHHANNVLLQTCDVVLLFVALLAMTGRPWPSAAVAALFAVHPINVESFAWVAERKAVLSVFFMLLTLIAYAWYAKRPSLFRYLALAVLFLCALMSKVMIITLPFAMLLLDYWPLNRFPTSENSADPSIAKSSLTRLLLEKIPLFLMSAGAGWLTLEIHRKDKALTAAMPMAWKVKNVIYSYAAYLGKAIWPTRLAVFYPHPENSLTVWKVVLAAVIIVGISILVYADRRRKYLVVGWLWYLGTAFPMIGLIQSGRQGMGDRYAYLPLVGIFIAVVWLFSDLAKKRRWNPQILAAVFLVLLLPFVYLTRKQISYWHNSITLFTHALEVTSRNGIAENNLGAALVETGQPQAALPHFLAAVQFAPDLASAHYNLGVLFQQQNQLIDAAAQYRQAIAVSPDPFEAAQAHNNLGILYLGLQNFPIAIAELNTAISLNPAKQNSYIARGTVEFQSSNFAAATADFAHAASLAPSPLALFWLGRSYEVTHDLDRAAGAYQAALQLAPNFVDARARLEALHGFSTTPQH